MKTSAIPALALALLVGPQVSRGAVVLTSVAPTQATNTFISYPSATPLKLTDSADYFGLPAYSRGATTLTGDRPAGSAFSSTLFLMTQTPPTSPTTNNSGFRQIGSNFGAYVQRTDGSTYSGGASNQAQAYANNTAVDGTSLTYTLAGHTSEQLTFYIASYNAMFEYDLSAAGQSEPLATLTTPTGMTGGGGSGYSADISGSGNNTGSLSFALTNPDDAPTTITFKLLYAGNVGASQSLGLQAATATAVPEPASLTVVGAGAAMLLTRRRR